MPAVVIYASAWRHFFMTCFVSEMPLLMRVPPPLKTLLERHFDDYFTLIPNTPLAITTLVYCRVAADIYVDAEILIYDIIYSFVFRGWSHEDSYTASSFSFRKQVIHAAQLAAFVINIYICCMVDYY
jgi:hypothetical protein